MSISSICGSGIPSHLALTISPATFTKISTVALLDPNHPGTTPLHLTTNTGPQITETNRKSATSLAKSKMYSSVKANLEKQLIAAVPGVFINELSNYVLGFYNIATLTLLMHLYTTYDNITANNVD